MFQSLLGSLPSFNRIAATVSLMRGKFQSLLGSLPSFNGQTIKPGEPGRSSSNPCWVPFPLSTNFTPDKFEPPLMFQSLLGSLPSFNMACISSM